MPQRLGRISVAGHRGRGLDAAVASDELRRHQGAASGVESIVEQVAEPSGPASFSTAAHVDEQAAYGVVCEAKVVHFEYFPTSCVPGIAETGSPLLRMLEMCFAAFAVTSAGSLRKVRLEIPAAL